MKKLLVLWVLLLTSIFSISQTTDTIATPNRNNIAVSGNDNTIYLFTEVDSLATFPGGRPYWIKYVENNLNPGVGVDNGAKKGTYNVRIKFTVTKDGTLKDFVPITKYKYGLEEEVIRILKLSPKWVPAKKNGVSVNSTVEQLQVFIISYGR